MWSADQGFRTDRVPHEVLLCVVPDYMQLKTKLQNTMGCVEYEQMITKLLCPISRQYNCLTIGVMWANVLEIDQDSKGTNTGRI